MSDWKQIVRGHLAPLRLPPEREIEIVEELAAHLEAVYEEVLDAGATEPEAQARAMRVIADGRLLECELSRVEQSHLSRWLPPLEKPGRGMRMESLLQDIRFGARMLLKQPGFTLIAVITLSLGIGANTAIFNFVNALLLRPLPYPDPGRLVAVESGNPQGGKGLGGGVSPADYRDWRAQSQTFAQLAAYVGTGISLRGDDQIEQVTGARVSGNFFQTFGVEPLLGRAFSAEEELANGPKAIVLSHRLWQRRFNGDPSIVGRALRLGAGTATIVGVMPPRFKFPGYAEAWEPLARDSSEMRVRANRYLRVAGRLRPGQTLDAAQAEMKTIASRLEAAYPKDNRNWTVQLTPWREYQVRGSRTAALVLLGAVGLVLLMACANVANLMLARATVRRKEMAVRMALGARRQRVLRQLLVESLLLAAVGGACGLLAAYWGSRALAGLLPESAWYFAALNAVRDELRMDAAVLLFTVLLTLLTGVLFGVMPAWQASLVNLNEALKESSRGADAAPRHRMRGALVIAEIALALVLLVGAGLLLQSFLRLQRVELGYDPRGLMTMNLALPRQNPALFARQVLEQVARTPGVEAVSLMSFPTFGGLNFPFNRESRPLPAGDENASYSAVTPDYFRTLGLGLRAGRLFNERDTPESPRVALINETLARQYFAGEEPIGQKLIVSYLGRRLTCEIAGVVSDLKQDSPQQPTKPEIFVPFEQQPWFAGWLLIRAAQRDPLPLRMAVQRAIWTVNKDLPAAKAETLEQMLADQLAAPRLYSQVLGLFAALALLLAAVGIYGVMSYAVAQRTHEFGIRMALGAQPGNLLKSVVGQGLKLTGLGVALGLIAAFGLTRLMQGLLFGVSAADPLTFAAIPLLLAGVALLACYIPARRATKVDPVIALRSE